MDSDLDDPEEEGRLIRIGGAIDATAVSLLISGDDLSPDEITRLLGFPPSRSWSKGETRPVGKSGRVSTFPTGRWVLESPKGKGDLDKHISWILDVLTADPQIWQDIRTRYGLNLFCGLFLEDWNRVASISAHLLSELGKRGIALDLDIYAFSPDDEQP